MPARAVPSHPQWAPCLAPWAGCGFYPSSWYKNSCHSVLKPGKCRGFPPGAVAWLSPPGCGRGQLELPRGPGGTLVMALVCLCCGLSFPLPTWQWGPWKDWCFSCPETQIHCPPRGSTWTLQQETVHQNPRNLLPHHPGPWDFSLL